MIADLPKWLSQRQASIFAMQSAKQVQQLLWQRWWCTLCQRLLYLHLQMSKFLLGREWSSNVEPQENRSRRWNGQNIELALLSSNYLIFIFLGLHTGFWTCWFVSDSLFDIYYTLRCVNTLIWLPILIPLFVLCFLGFIFFRFSFSVELHCWGVLLHCLFLSRRQIVRETVGVCWTVPIAVVGGHRKCIQRCSVVMKGLNVMVIDGFCSCI